MGDLFHSDIKNWMIEYVFAAMALSVGHYFLLLTKRPERMADFITGIPARAFEVAKKAGELTGSDAMHDAIYNTLTNQSSGLYGSGWPLPNVCIGVTVCNQEEADLKIPILLQIPAAMRFISVEPMLSQIDFHFFDRPPVPNCSEQNEDGTCGYSDTDPECHQWTCRKLPGFNGIGWVICGGETGPGARPMHPDWVRGVRDQCQDAGGPFFFKQWGEWGPENDPTDRNMFGLPTTLEYSGRPCGHIPGFGDHSRCKKMLKYGKKAAGHLLDGREWRQVPEVLSKFFQKD
jgi:protein gp37